MIAKLIFLFIACFLIINDLWCEKDSIIRENQLLEIELSLTKKPKLYFIFNITEKKIYLKAKGIQLREWEIKKMRNWGDPLPMEPVSLVKKSTLFPPKREKIMPNHDKEEKEFKLEALELHDMPSSYTLFFKEGTFVYIRSKPKGLISIPYNIAHIITWFTVHPIETVWFSVKRKPFTAVYIALNNKREAQALYWAFIEGSACIFISH